MQGIALVFPGLSHLRSGFGLGHTHCVSICLAQPSHSESSLFPTSLSIPGMCSDRCYLDLQNACPTSCGRHGEVLKSIGYFWRSCPLLFCWKPWATLKSLVLVVYLYPAAAAKSLQSCLTVRPHKRQPTRLPCPCDSPGKNTGMGCHFLLQCMKVKSESEVAQSCPTLSNPMDCSPPGSSIRGIFQTRVLEWGAIAFSNFEVRWT